MKLLSVEYRRLVEIFRRAALVVAPATSMALSGCGPCDPIDQIYLLRDPDAETQALIDACRGGTADDCTPLCLKVAGGLQYGTFDHCELHADSNGYAVVHLGWKPVCPGGRRPAGMVLR